MAPQLLKKLFGLTLKNTLDDNDRIAIKDSSVVSGDPDRNVLFSVLRTYILKPLTDATFAFLNGIQLSSARKAFQELTSTDPRTGDDWYTIAISDEETAFQSASAEFVANFGNVSLGCEIAYTSSTTAKTHQNTTVKLLAQSKIGTASPSNGILGFRLAKSDISASAGAKVQVRLQSSAANLKLTSQMVKNISAVGFAGWKLIQPTIIDNDKCPDGSPATFLEAGAEYNFSFSDVFIQGFTAAKLTNDQIACSVSFPVIPKIGTVLSITIPTTNLVVIDGDGSFSTMTTGSFTITNLSFEGRVLTFLINQTGIATVLNVGVILFKTNGTNGKMTIS